MISFSKWLILASLMLACVSTQAADKSQFYGSWKGLSGKAINIHFSRDMRYVYQYKMLTFSGKWSISEHDLTLNYSVLGVQKKKISSYSLRNGFLTLRNNEHSTVVLKKTNP
ncbi:hypothetical protein EOL70_09235 [Leucothrix sargassi]|nr:hypothetical protein EOL70_09235 [Leucothrix sargassi]